MSKSDKMSRNLTNFTKCGAVRSGVHENFNCGKSDRSIALVLLQKKTVEIISLRNKLIYVFDNANYVIYFHKIINVHKFYSVTKIQILLQLHL